VKESVILNARALGLDVEVQRLESSTRTVSDAARAVGCEEGEIAKSIVFVADGEARGGPHLLGGGLAHLGHVERVGELAGIDAVLAGGDADDRVAVGHEHDRLGDLRLLAADRLCGVADSARGGLQPLELDVEP